MERRHHRPTRRRRAGSGPRHLYLATSEGDAVVPPPPPLSPQPARPERGPRAGPPPGAGTVPPGGATISPARALVEACAVASWLAVGGPQHPARRDDPRGLRYAELLGDSGAAASTVLRLVHDLLDPPSRERLERDVAMRRGGPAPPWSAALPTSTVVSTLTRRRGREQEHCVEIRLDGSVAISIVFQVGGWAIWTATVHDGPAELIPGPSFAELPPADLRGPLAFTSVIVVRHDDLPLGFVTHGIELSRWLLGLLPEAPTEPFRPGGGPYVDGWSKSWANRRLSAREFQAAKRDPDFAARQLDAMAAVCGGLPVSAEPSPPFSIDLAEVPERRRERTTAIIERLVRLETRLQPVPLRAGDEYLHIRLRLLHRIATAPGPETDRLFRKYASSRLAAALVRLQLQLAGELGSRQDQVTTQRIATAFDVTSSTVARLVPLLVAPAGLATMERIVISGGSAELAPVGDWRLVPSHQRRLLALLEPLWARAGRPRDGAAG
ncbi:MAG: hypothetical protein R2715_00690 [Ilumatobacteraceae bacterium]